jgi:serine/threonine-protein kinase HipA
MIKRFDLYINTAELGVMQIAEVALLEEQGLINTVGFRYTANYLAQSQAFAIDPVQLPLSPKEFTLNCRQAAPAFIDDYLPDAWGKKVLTRLAMQQHQQRLNANCISEMLGC